MRATATCLEYRQADTRPSQVQRNDRTEPTTEPQRGHGEAETSGSGSGAKRTGVLANGQFAHYAARVARFASLRACC